MTSVSPKRIRTGDVQVEHAQQIFGPLTSHDTFINTVRIFVDREQACDPLDGDDDPNYEKFRDALHQRLRDFRHELTSNPKTPFRDIDAIVALENMLHHGFFDLFNRFQHDALRPLQVRLAVAVESLQDLHSILQDQDHHHLRHKTVTVTCPVLKNFISRAKIVLKNYKAADVEQENFIDAVDTLTIFDHDRAPYPDSNSRRQPPHLGALRRAIEAIDQAAHFLRTIDDFANKDAKLHHLAHPAKPKFWYGTLIQVADGALNPTRTNQVAT